MLNVLVYSITFKLSYCSCQLQKIYKCVCLVSETVMLYWIVGLPFKMSQQITDGNDTRT